MASRITRTGWFILGGLLVALLVAGVVSNYASTHPDGLDAATRVGCTVDATGAITGGTCAAQGEQAHELEGGPLADYGVSGIDSANMSKSLAGVLGVLLTFVVGGGLFWLVRTRQPATADRPSGDPVVHAAVAPERDAHLSAPRRR